ncbi:hypothetical protein QQS21_005148 [Conoideocrella luteorostrata]|uniref:Sulfhydryl oxidase n=1 Tax=Conoideocrella luteorostrata TaxID=1105319 RepID=A0AAJ0FU28_9HYPO|nr:hypothetical protein QQS21_005148 [Conoideocrella luteorostrata]
MARRQHLTLAVLLVFIVLMSISYLFSGPSSFKPHAPTLKSGREAEVPLREVGKPTDQQPTAAPPSADPKSDFKIDLDAIPNLSEGDSIAPKLENATLKAELGRATWKFLHTMVAKFPDKPTDNDRKTLESFFHLFGRLYPCGDCARHFREMLQKYPPQTSSRNAAAGWLCASHNVVNKRLNKPQFDCTKIGDFYDCGCGDDKKGKGPSKKEKREIW